MPVNTDVMPLHVSDWRPIPKGPLLGFCSVRLPCCGLLIRNVTLLQGPAGVWAALPGKPKVSGEGIALRDNAGKQQFSTILEWPSRQVSERFSAAVIAGIQREWGANALDAPETA